MLMFILIAVGILLLFMLYAVTVPAALVTCLAVLIAGVLAYRKGNRTWFNLRTKKEATTAIWTGSVGVVASGLIWVAIVIGQAGSDHPNLAVIPVSAAIGVALTLVVIGVRNRPPRRTSSGRYWTHDGCSIRHRSEDTANRCKVGRDPGSAPVEDPDFARAKFRDAISNLIVTSDSGAPTDDLVALTSAAYFVTSSQYGSGPMLQRKMGVGVTEAGRLLNMLEDAGIVSAASPSGSRDVLLTSDLLPTKITALRVVCAANAD